MPEILVPPKAALDILRDACRLNEEGEAALQARVRQLIEMDATGLTRDVAHARRRFGLTELAQLAVAISLTKAHIQPAVAARIVREGWPQLVPFALAGIGDLLPDRFRRLRPTVGGPHAFIEGNALAELGRKSVRDGRGGGSLPTITTFADRAGADTAAEESDAGTCLTSSRFMARIFELVVARAVAPEDIWESLTRLRQSAVPKG